MTLFTLPLSWQNGRISASSSTFPQTAGQSTSRKRKRSSPLNSTSSPKTKSAFSTPPNLSSPPSSSPASNNTNLHYAYTNPLSLNADEARQYRAAGLELDKELPSITYTGFPHRSLPWETSFATNDEDQQVAKLKSGNISTNERDRDSHLKVRHLGVLTTVLQRCLAEGDIVRASKAWALLLRSQVGGKRVDLRSTGYWSFGAEILMRSTEEPSKGKLPVSNTATDGDLNCDHSKSQVLDSVEETLQTNVQDLEAVRWGHAEGLEMVRNYYARLILQHPYKRQFSTAISALDFWPAMLSCEIYGIQYEQQQSLHQITTCQSCDDSESTSEPTDSLSGEEANNLGDDEVNATGAAQEELFFGNLAKRESRARQRQQLKIWKKKEAVRKHARMAAEKVAMRMDNIMSAPPFADSHVLHRLRAYLALYIGDLSALTSWAHEREAEEGEASARAKKSEIEIGAILRDEMREVAKAHFLAARRKGGGVSDWEAVETTLGYEGAFL